MKVTNVEVTFPDPPEQRVRAWVKFTLGGCFVVKGSKVVRLPGGKLIVSMPVRKVTRRCVVCEMPNHLLANYCNRCGVKLDWVKQQIQEQEAEDEEDVELFHDIAHPITKEMREEIEREVLLAYHLATLTKAATVATAG